MDSEASSSSFVKGVPMPPTAWALASMWAAVWEAPRFRGSSPLLKREELDPLLKVAASCVAALLPHITAKSRQSQLPPYGASRELLVAALDGAPAGVRLAKPYEDPRGFVRALVRAAFTTGDGDLVEGFPPQRLEQLLQLHCAEQLQVAKKLLCDPTAALKAALDRAVERVSEVLTLPPAAGDFAAVARRLSLAQHLERLSEEADMLTIEGQQGAQGEHAQDDGRLDALGGQADTTGLPSTPRQCARQRHDRDDSPTGNGTEVSVDNYGVPEEEQHDASESLERTRSQTASSVKVQKVKRHLDESKDVIHDLGRTITQLARKEAPPADSIAALEAELAAVEQARKRARNFGEDLLEDMLELDRLQNLSAQDRSTRKASIAGIEALLQDVDDAKSRLGTLHRELEAKLSAAKAKEAAKARELERRAAEQHAAAEQARRSLAKEAGDEQVDSAHADEKDARQATVQPRLRKKRRTSNMTLEAPQPTKEHWLRLRLPLRFHSREERDHYIILASVPGLDTEELKLQLGEGNSTLQVEGLRLPSAQEAAAMQHKITERLKTLTSQAPEEVARLQGSLDDVATDAYIELGQDEYGRFSETFRLPQDVDVNGIDASYRDGVLRVILPKMTPHYPSAEWSDGMRGGRYASGRRGLPTTAILGYGPTCPNRGPGLFGGVDDSFYW